MSSVPVIKFLFRSEWKVLSEALNLNPIYESVELGSANDLSTYLSGSTGGLIVTSLRDKNDLLQLASFVKLIKRNQNPPYVKVFVINFSGDKQFERAVAKLGILDIIEDKIQTKALRFKIDFMMKSVNAQVKKHAQVQANASVKSLENSKAQEKKVSENTPIWELPLDCEDDIWLLKNDQDCKRVLTRWLVKLMGPSPYVAQWTETGTAGVWKFEFKGENDFIYGKGNWFYRGDQKPDFIWSENIWSFTGSSFDLFYKEGDSVDSRLKLKDKVLTIAKNSDYAKTKEKSIADSFDKDLVFKKEGMAAAEADVLDKDQEKYQNLEGKGKTDTLNQGPLSGKGKTSNINTDPLSMDLKPGDNNTSSDPLSQKGSNSKSSSYWKGKNEYAQDGEGGPSTTQADQKTNEGSELGMDSKNKLEKFYKNHNEAEKFDAKDIGHAIKKDGVSDNLKGKTSTDELEGHLTSPDAKKEKALKEKKQEEMSGKASTDKLPGHLSSPDGKKEKEAAEKQAGDLKGKSSTDKMPGHLSSTEKEAKSPAAEKERAEREAVAASEKEARADKPRLGRSQTESEVEAKTAEEKAIADKKANEKKASDYKEEAKKDLAGKTSTDKLAGHLSSPDAAAAKKPAVPESQKYLDQDNEKFEETGTRKDLQELKDALNSSKKNAPAASAKKSEGGTDEISTHYTSKTSNKSQESESEADGKVLPFGMTKKPAAAQEIEEVLTGELAEAVMTAKVTSFLIQDSVKVKCELDDHFDQTIIFITNENGLTASKTVNLNLNFNYMNKDTNLKFDANVMQIEADGEGSHYVTVEISKENVSAFNSFMKLYATRQNNINLFLKTAKGL